jgi:hypothetical protein
MPLASIKAFVTDGLTQRTRMTGRDAVQTVGSTNIEHVYIDWEKAEFAKPPGMIEFLNFR